jgi:hypothetical protein
VDESLVALVVRTCPSLSLLNLSRCRLHLGDALLVEMAQGGLARNLTFVDLSWCYPGQAGLAALIGRERAPALLAGTLDDVDDPLVAIVDSSTEAGPSVPHNWCATP